MTSHRVVTIFTLLALLLAALAPATAGANPLLSGYGGPGQGNQVILGSTLINGPSNGGGASSASGGSGESAATGDGTLAAAAGQQASSASSSTTSPSSSSSSRSTSSQSNKLARARHQTRSAKRKSSAGVSAPKEPVTAPVLARADDVGSQALGLSGTDLLDIALALAALLATAALTGRLTRRAR